MIKNTRELKLVLPFLILVTKMHRTPLVHSSPNSPVESLYLSHHGTSTDSISLSVSLSLKDSLVPIDSSSLNILHHSAGTYVSSVIYWTGTSGEHMNDNQAFVCP